MAKKPQGTDVFQMKITRNDRFAQMSHQERLIEQKKREIQAKLEHKKKTNTTSEAKGASSSSGRARSPPKFDPTFNQFSNDGSFLDQFKQMKEKKPDQKSKPFRNRQDRMYSDDQLGKNNKWSSRRHSQSPKSNLRLSRFSDKQLNEPKISISTSYTNLISQANFNVLPPQLPQISTQNVIGQPLLKNDTPIDGISFSTVPPTSTSVIAAPPVMLNMPPPQIATATLVTQPAVLTVTNSPSMFPENAGALGLMATPISTVPNMQTVNLSSIPPPNTIQVTNIQQQETIGTISLPPPVALQMQNIPPPSCIQLNEIPNPKPLDILNIPTPTDGLEKSLSDVDFIKNVPPPNRSVPPPSIQDSVISVNINVPPPNPNSSSSLLPLNTMPPSQVMASQNVTQLQQAQHSAGTSTSILNPQIIQAQITSSAVLPQVVQTQPPPQIMQAQNISVQNLLPPQNIVVHSISAQQVLSGQGMQTISNLQNVLVPTVQNLAPPPPPPPPVPQSSLGDSLPSAPVTVISASSASNIPSLLAQPILPPPTLNLAQLPVNMHCPPPVVLPPTSNSSMQDMGRFIGQVQLMDNQIPHARLRPPIEPPGTSMAQFKDINAGTAEYEAMASLARIVAQCGQGIEDVVCQRNPQDPNLWFLFHKESMAFQQYQQLIEQFKAEQQGHTISRGDYKPEDIYEPEMCLDDDRDKLEHMSKWDNRCRLQDGPAEDPSRRKRKSRWGDKAASVPPPTLVMPVAPTLIPHTSVLPSGPSASGGVMLTKINRGDPGLIQYALNTYHTTNLSDEDWKKAEESYKVHLVYQEMLRKKNEAEKLAQAGKHKYEYDSDEEVDGGTWEHKLRQKEMETTTQWATGLTQHAEGKHHIGDFLPSEELRKFLEKSSAAKEGRIADMSDYKDFQIKEDNVGFKMLQKLGWSEGQGLGASASGIVEPVNKGLARDQNQGLGLMQPGNLDNADDEYDAYRKRMMLAYRFRPNPLNNPRRPYY